MHRSMAWRVFCGLVLCVVYGDAARGTQITLEDGRILKGKMGPPIISLVELPKGATAQNRNPSIVFIDDSLRRTYLPQRMAVAVGQELAEPQEKFSLPHKIYRGSRTVKAVGPILRITPFDEYGRRIFTMNTAQGSVDIVQGITELTPQWAKVEGLTHVWDMRIATSSVPQEMLTKILTRQLDAKNVEDCRKLARFYVQCEWYQAAAKEVQALLSAHPELKAELEPSLAAIRKMGAQRFLNELTLRRNAGQHGLARARLKDFPTEGVPGEMLQAVREMIQKCAAEDAARAEVLKQLETLGEQVREAEVRKRVEAVRKEIADELSPNTLPRLAAFRQVLADGNTPAEDKVALAISGWLLGANAAVPKLSLAVSLVEVRRMIREYLAAPDKLRRMKALAPLQSEEAARPEQVAQLLAHMKPPIELPPAEDEAAPRAVEIPGVGSAPPVRYLVQLPPEYDPYRLYPTIVTLHGARTTAEHQIDWWAGSVTKGGWRAGQASRHGYIVIAPDWSSEHQKHYGYSAREHAAVLDSLRDACQRFSVDTDRVFLSGVSMGGDAAWDIGLAHPDLWAGVIPIVAQSDRYCEYYWKNAALLPLYFVNGELDGGKMAANAKEFDRYLTASKDITAGRQKFNTTVVEFLGRGHEDFSDEILRLFDWMSHFRREFFPKRFTAYTMRSGDNAFWWLEIKHMPPRAVVDPAQWPPPRGTRALETTATINGSHAINVTTGAGQLVIWLSPDMVDLDRKLIIKVNGRPITSGAQGIAPDLDTLLEDARVRGDRQHPFWAKVASATGRLSPDENR